MARSISYNLEDSEEDEIMGLKRAKDLVGIGLGGFAVKVMTEVFEVDGKGERTKSKGFLEDEELAKSFILTQPDPKSLRTMDCSILTDGKMGFLLNVEPVFLMNADGAKQMVKEKALAKLTPLEQKLVREQ